VSKAILTGLGAIALAQALKVPAGFAQSGEWDWNAAAETGGMPSAHSAGVAALSTYLALRKGVSAIDFAISALFGMIVMYDAMGIRRHAGEMAAEINALDVEVERLRGEQPGEYHRKREHALRERLGHMPREVAAGALLGVAAGAAVYAMERR
jgi:acid phosphatase family membrane protein YuiD